MKYDLIKLGTLNAAVSGTKIKQSIAFLVSKRPDLQPFDSVEDLAIAIDEDPTTKIAGFEQNSLQVRNAIAKVLWGNSLYWHYLVVFHWLG